MTQPAGFLPYQWELREAVRQEKVVVVEKSRRTGYSWAAAEVAVEHAAKSKQDGGMDVSVSLAWKSPLYEKQPAFIINGAAILIL